MKDPLRSPRLLYRAIEDDEGDHLLIQSIRSDSVAWMNTTPCLPVPGSVKSAKEFQTSQAENSLLAAVICLPPRITKTASYGSPTPIGYISLTKAAGNSLQHHRNSMVDIGLVASYRGQGYGTEAIEWVLDWGFRHAGLHRIEIGCFSSNEGARRLYERIGFVFEGRAREALWVDGGWHDILSFSVLEHEWKLKRTAES